MVNDNPVMMIATTNMANYLEPGGQELLVAKLGVANCVEKNGEMIRTCAFL